MCAEGLATIRLKEERVAQESGGGRHLAGRVIVIMVRHCQSVWLAVSRMAIHS